MISKLSRDEDKYCPVCGCKTLYFIEQCESSEDEVKTSWSCECSNIIIYIYELERIKRWITN